MQNYLQEVIQYGDDVPRVVSFIVEHYINNRLTCNTDVVKLLHSKLQMLIQISKKKQRDASIKQISLIGVLFNKIKASSDYTKKVTCDISQIEAILNSNPTIADFSQDNTLSSLKTLLDQEKITYDMLRLFTCILSEMNKHNKREVLQLVIFLNNQKAPRIHTIEYIEIAHLPTSAKKDVVWYLWYLLLLHSKTLSISVQVFVNVHLQLYTLYWTKKCKPMRLNLLCHIFAVLSSSNIDKYITHTKHTEHHTSFDYLNCFTAYDSDLAKEVERDRIEYTAKLKEHSKNVAAAVQV